MFGGGALGESIGEALGDSGAGKTWGSVLGSTAGSWAAKTMATKIPAILAGKATASAIAGPIGVVATLVVSTAVGIYKNAMKK
jgi:hypothetical protein